ncbi:maltose ABC transporter permease MalF [Corallincola platygyrae]|uniref:Maltose/maltodextrin transport system permease protein n=1 Tax=Corallincola platygyrae TaxID=1193278 RepID=A0ABW4XNN8_9GAMM
MTISTSMTLSSPHSSSNSLSFKRFLVLLLAGGILLSVAYALVHLYAMGEYAIAIVTLILGLSSAYLLYDQAATGWRFIYPAMVLVFLLMLFPIVYSVTIAFTNYSSKNLLTYERTVSYLLEQTYAEKAERLRFSLHAVGEQHQLFLKDKHGNQFATAPFNLPDKPKDDELAQLMELPLQATSESPPNEALKMRDVIKVRSALKQLRLTREGEAPLSMLGMREFLPLLPQYEVASDTNLPLPDRSTDLLLDKQSNRYLQANYDTGFFAYLDEKGDFTDDIVTPGFVTQVGFANFLDVFGMAEERWALLKITLWTISFAFLTVLMQFSLGMLLASILNWHRIKGQRILRTLLIVPFAVPGFISIMIFRAMFNTDFGEVNALLEYLFGVKLDWYYNPWLAKLQVLLVNLWLGFPYFMLLCMGMLKSIPEDLYEAANMDGAGTWYKLRYITLPMIIKPIVPLLILSFTFNFNNFNVIFLLTAGGPMMENVSAQIGDTQLLIHYIYGLVKGHTLGYEAYGLGSALSAYLFLFIASISLWQFWLTREKTKSREAVEV